MLSLSPSARLFRRRRRHLTQTPTEDAIRGKVRLQGLLGLLTSMDSSALLWYEQNLWNAGVQEEAMDTTTVETFRLVLAETFVE